VEVEGPLTRAQRREAASSDADLFQDVSVPVEVFVCTSGELATSLEEGWWSGRRCAPHRHAPGLNLLRRMFSSR